MSRLNQLRHGPGGATYKIIATGDSTNNTMFTMECNEPPGGGTPLHLHTREDEFFYVLDGTLSLYVDGKTIELTAGQSIFAARNIPHCFKNRTDKFCRYLVTCTPHHIEAFFDYGAPNPDGSAPTTDQLIQKIMTLAPQFGIQILGPSPL